MALKIFKVETEELDKINGKLRKWVHLQGKKKRYFVITSGKSEGISAESKKPEYRDNKIGKNK